MHKSFNIWFALSKIYMNFKEQFLRSFKIKPNLKMLLQFLDQFSYTKSG